MHGRVVVGIGISGLLVVAAGMLARDGRPDPADFVDALTGPETHLEIPFEKYRLSPAGLLRSFSDNGRLNGGDRPMIRTASGEYLSRDFVFELEIAIPAAAEDLAFVGFGAAESAPPYNEPCGAWVFRVHHLPETHRVQFGGCPMPEHGKTASHVALETLGEIPDSGVLTVRLERDGDLLTASLPGQAGARRTVRLSEFPSLIHQGRSYLFFGNTAEGTSFRNVKVRPRA